MQLYGANFKFDIDFVIFFLYISCSKLTLIFNWLVKTGILKFLEFVFVIFVLYSVIVYIYSNILIVPSVLPFPNSSKIAWFLKEWKESLTGVQCMEMSEVIL